MSEYIEIADILVDPQSAIGKDFHYECEMVLPDTPFANALSDMASYLSEGEPDIISIDGRVVYCDSEFAVIRVHHSFIEFDHYMFSFEETAERFPDFEDKTRTGSEDYLWLSLEDGFFTLSDPTFEDDETDVPEELEKSVLDIYEAFKQYRLTITLPHKELVELAPGLGEDSSDLSKGINRAVHWMENAECAILTAWRDGNTRAQNDSDNDDLQHSLRNCGFGVIKVKGIASWGKEDSFITFKRNQGDMPSFYDTVFSLSAKYEQDCFLYKQAGLLSPAYLVGTNDSFGIGRKENIGLLRINEMSPEAYSEIGSGTISFTKNEA